MFLPPPQIHPPSSMINAVLTTFPGLPSLALPVPSSTTILDLHNGIAARLASLNLLPTNLLLTTARGTFLSPYSDEPISTLTQNSLLPLRLGSTLPGGKGGFGSQLRAAGGRMSSRKKRGQEENSDSCRNLDGRRLRTVKEAKALAAYLEIKPEMDRKEREKRRERWKKVVEQAERREAEERGEEVLGGKRFEDTEWLDRTEEERERLREAVIKAMNEGAFEEDREMRDASPGSSGTSSGADEEAADQDEEIGNVKKVVPAVPKPSPPAALTAKAGPKFAGFDDDDDEFMTDDDEEEEEVEKEGKAKGKAKA
ncbi:telomere stability and silencing-domain-containing protein [Kalaharituber pfeilii]|nr:telomere stability and silencing-domain-containing protein [Kalaharituber pfeilii]